MELTHEQQRAIKDAIRAAYDTGYNHGNKDGSLSCSRYVGGNVESAMGNRLIATLTGAEMVPCCGDPDCNACDKVATTTIR